MKKINALFCLFILGISYGYAQTSNWTLHGPTLFPTNISGQINGIGRVCQIKFDPSLSNTLYACSASGGFWKSTNNGSSWTSMGTDQLPEMRTSSACIDFTNSNIIYLSSGDPNYYSTDLGLWKTVDGGLNWNQINTGIGTRMAVELLMDPSDHLSIIAATNDGIWKTTDGGASWNLKLSGNQFTDMAWQPGLNTSIVYASSMNKFFRSIDKGDSWLEITSGLSGISGGTRMAVSAANPSIVYLGTIQDEGTIFKSTDSGQSFTITYHDPARSLTGYDTTGGGQGNYNFCLEANPNNADELFLGSHNIWRSQDGGVNWSKLTNWWQTVHTDMHDYCFHPTIPNLLFQANDGGVWSTSNAGVDWTQRSDGLSATENYHAAASPLYEGLLSSGTQDNGELVHLDSTWKTNRGGDWTTQMQMDYSPSKFIYYYDDKERRSLPSGEANDYGIQALIPGTNYRQFFSPDNQDIAYASVNSIWRSTNLTSSSPIWTLMYTGTSFIKSMSSPPGHPNIFIFSNTGKVNISHNALDANPSFTSTTMPFTSAALDVIISAKDTNFVYALLGSKVYKSTDGGISFSDMSNGLPAITHLKLNLDQYSSDQSLYLGTSLGVYYTNKNMSSWINYSGALPTIAPIRDVLFYNNGGLDDRLYVSYFGRGIWQTDLENSSVCTVPTFTNSAWQGKNFSISWNSTGATMYDVQYREVGTLSWVQVSNSTNNYSISDFSGCSSYEARVRARCGSDTSLWSSKVYFQTPSNTLNSDFDGHMDIGGITVAGSVCYDSVKQQYTILAEGEDIWDKQDEFHFLYRKMISDISISARVKHVGNIYGWAKAGVMIRETLNNDSKHAICAMTPGNGFAMQWREQTNDWTSNKDTAGAAPGWVKLTRVGNTVTSYFSTDGNVWNELKQANIAMNDTVYVGLANCSHVDSTLNDAIFDHIRFNDTALSITQLPNEQVFTIFPNPSSDEITIRFKETPSNPTVTVNIIDISGKIISSRKVLIINSDVKIPLTKLAKGSYFLLIQGKQTSAVQFTKN